MFPCVWVNRELIFPKMRVDGVRDLSRVCSYLSASDISSCVCILCVCQVWTRATSCCYLHYDTTEGDHKGVLDWQSHNFRLLIDVLKPFLSLMESVIMSYWTIRGHSNSTCFYPIYTFRTKCGECGRCCSACLPSAVRESQTYVRSKWKIGVEPFLLLVPSCGTSCCCT